MTFKKDWEALYGHSPADFDKMVDAGARIAELERDLAEARDEVERFHQEAQESATQAGKALRELEQARSNALAYLANQGNLNLELTRERDAARAEADKLRAELAHVTTELAGTRQMLDVMTAPTPPTINSAGVGSGNCNCQAVKGTLNYPGPWHPRGDTPTCLKLAAPTAAPQPDGPSHCGLCGSGDCPGVPGKGCMPGPFEAVNRKLDVLCECRDDGQCAHNGAAGAGGGEQDTATTERAA